MYFNSIYFLKELIASTKKTDASIQFNFLRKKKTSGQIALKKHIKKTANQPIYEYLLIQQNQIYN